MILALWTGQRQGDLLRLPWSAYDGQMIRLKQSKTGARVMVPVGAPLKAALDATKTGVTFHDLRGTAVLRLFLAGGTKAEIATITGHSLRDVRSILDSHYFCRDPALAQSAITKLEIGGRKKSAKSEHIFQTVFKPLILEACSV